MPRPTSRVFVAFVVLVAACAAKEPPAPATPSATDPAGAAEGPAPVASAEPASAAAPERKRKPFEIYSNCSDVVTVVFSEDPKAPKAGTRNIAPSSAIEGPRESDGNQTVWLLDGRGEPLVRVRVTRGMKRVEIGKSCRTMDAR